MKTKEFIKLIEDAEFTIEDIGDYLYVRNDSHSRYEHGVYCKISKKHEYCFDTNYILFTQLGSDTRGLITSALYAYSQTPIAERESIELSPVERVILDNLSHEYTSIRLDEGSVLTLEDSIVSKRYFDMFGELFDWVKRGEVYNIEDLLNDWDVAE